ncbi:MAG: 1-acyl-sn-glycerol-3-phosphate acyltransferase [Alloprevotella sp.]|nr:1-acyl-sn-glycerol-3-phosphate acyltransferase [Alloprevotella sp.]
MPNLYHKVLYRLLGWTVETDRPLPDKCIFCVAPHTSNWDFIIGELYIRSIGKNANFLMKREWFFWPLGILLRRMGGIPVERSRKTSLTDQLAERALQSDTFRLAVTPEGTRSKATTWKRGFYYIALKAGLPILLYAIDYRRRRIVCTDSFIPTGDTEAEMRRIMDYYRPFADGAKRPDLFAVEDIATP